MRDPAPSDGEHSQPLLICDLTQSWSPSAGGGISTYLREKSAWLMAATPHHLLQIVPGDADRITVSGRHLFAEIRADPVRGSPDYRFILRTRAVRALLAQYRPDIIESLCPWVLPWTAINHRRAFPRTALVAGYRTDFPNAHVYRVARAKFGTTVARGLRALSWGYAEITYRAFDHVYTLSEPARAALAWRRITRTSLLPLGVDSALFSPARRDPALRAQLGLAGDGPLLIYAGRIDNEKRTDRLVAMMRALPADCGAALVMVGDGKLRAPLQAAAGDLPIRFTGFIADRRALARMLASADIYVSAMADETFGIAVLEAQACGLPVVGVAAGAMDERVPPGLGLLGPVDDAAAMADNVMRVWHGDRAAMAAVARRHAVQRHGWDRTFETLLRDIYSAALAQAARRVRAGRRETVAADPPC